MLKKIVVINQFRYQLDQTFFYKLIHFETYII